MWTRLAWWAIPLLSILVYLPSFRADFTLDDVLIVEENNYVKSLDKIPAIWTSHYWAGKIDASDTGLYRPLTLTTYNLQYALSGEKPGPFHVVNILLHALACFVFMKFIHLLHKEELLAFAAGILFSLHPVHTEAVAGIVGRAEILAALFILMAGISYHHYRKNRSGRWLLFLGLSTLGGITSKEHGFMLPALLFLQELYYRFAWKSYSWSEKSKWIALGSVTFITVVMWMYRSSVTGPTVSHELWRDIPAQTRMATAVRISAEYVWMHLFPWKLSADYWTGETPITGWGDWKNLLSLAAMAGLVVLGVAFRRKWPLFTWGILFFFLTLLPVSNFLFAAGFIKAERILYIPSIGLIVSIAFLLKQLYQTAHLRALSYGLLAVLIVFFSFRTWSRAMDWQNNYTLALATLKTAPDSPRFNNMMGLEMREQDKPAEALYYFEKSVQYNPTHVPALVNLGTEYRNQNRLPEAAATLEKALAIDPNTMATYVNLMTVYRSMENYDKNVEVAEKAMKRYPQSAAVMWNAANAWQLKGDMEKANALRARAKAIEPGIDQGK